MNETNSLSSRALQAPAASATQTRPTQQGWHGACRGEEGAEAEADRKALREEKRGEGGRHGVLVDSTESEEGCMGAWGPPTPSEWE